jgi:hypothetical protein
MSVQLSPYYRLAKVGGHAADWRLTGRSGWPIYLRGPVGSVVYDVVGGYESFSIVGYTRDSAGNPLASCTVTAFNADNDVPLVTGTSDGTGYFQFDNRGDGPFYLVAFDPSGNPIAVGGTTRSDLQASPSPLPAIGLFTSTLPTSENPLSLNSSLVQGLAVGIDFNNTQCTGGAPGFAFATVFNPTGFADSICCLKTSVGISSTRHAVKAVVKRDAGYAPLNGHETELLLNFNITPNSNRGYEIQHGLGQTVQVIRQDGAAGSFTPQGTGDFTMTPNGAFNSDVQDGDVVEVLCTTNLSGVPTLTYYLNSVYQWDLTDSSPSRIQSGQPGFGFFCRGTGSPAGVLASYGWRGPIVFRTV